MNLFWSLYCLLFFQFNATDVKIEAFVEPISLKNSVSDYGNLFTDEEEDQLSTKLSEIARADNISYMVVTVESLGGNPVFRVATKLLGDWKKTINEKRQHPYDAGILILFSRDDSVAYIATSQETDDYLPHQKIKEIIEIDVVPSLRHGHYLKGTVKGVDAVHHYLKPSFRKKRSVDYFLFLPYLVGVIIFVFGVIKWKRYN